MLTVRDINPWEGPGVFALTGNVGTMKYMGFATHSTVDEAYSLIARYADSPARWQAVVEDSNPSEILGIFGLELQRHFAAITIMFRREARGAGRRFSVPLVQWILTKPQVWRVWAYCHVENIPVQRVLERMGAKREGCMRRFELFPNISNEPQDCYLYAITKGQSHG